RSSQVKFGFFRLIGLSGKVKSQTYRFDPRTYHFQLRKRIAHIKLNRLGSGIDSNARQFSLVHETTEVGFGSFVAQRNNERESHGITGEFIAEQLAKRIKYAARYHLLNGRRAENVAANCLGAAGAVLVVTGIDIEDRCFLIL